MKRYTDYGITLLKDFNIKENTEELRKDIYDINDILYKHQYRYTLNQTSYRLLDTFIEYGKKIKGYNFNKQSLKDKQAEVLVKLHDICVKLKMIATEVYTNSEYYYAAESIQKYAVSCYLKQKDILSDDDVIRLLKENMDMYKDINNDSLISKPFRKMQEELLERISNKYKF